MEKFPNFDIDKFLEEQKLDPKFECRSDKGNIEYSINCLNPECNEGRPDQEHKLWINDQTGGWCCYRCGMGGGPITLVMKVLRAGFRDATKILKGSVDASSLTLMNYTLHDNYLDIDLGFEDEVMEREVELPYGYEPVEGPHPYLKGRGVPWQLAKSLGWGFCDSGTMKNRLIVPIFQQDRVVFWQARDILDTDHPDWGDKKEYRKVRNPLGVSARRVLYNYDIAKKYKSVILTEGFMDCVKAGPNAMATNGKKLHARQIELLMDAGVEEVTLLWDRDAFTDGKKKDGKWTKPPSAIRYGRMLKDFFVTKFAILPNDKDPGSYKLRSKELKTIIENAKEMR